LTTFPKKTSHLWVYAPPSHINTQIFVIVWPQRPSLVFCTDTSPVGVAGGIQAQLASLQPRQMGLKENKTHTSRRKGGRNRERRKERERETDRQTERQ
jgi:hypothetical protein